MYKTLVFYKTELNDKRQYIAVDRNLDISIDCAVYYLIVNIMSN